MSVLLIRTSIVFLLLTVAMRLSGKRQIGQLQVSEFITALLLSELAASPITEPDIPLLHSVVPIFFLAATEVIVTFFSSRLPALKKLTDGRPTVIIKDGAIYQDELSRLRLSPQELLAMLRNQGIGDPRDVRYALIEQNGTFSAFPKHDPRGLILNPLVANGHICTCSLRLADRDRAWVRAQVNARGDRIGDIFLFAVDDYGNDIYIRKVD